MGLSWVGVSWVGGRIVCSLSISRGRKRGGGERDAPSKGETAVFRLTDDWVDGWVGGWMGEGDLPSKVETAVLRLIGAREAATAVMVRNCSSKGYLWWVGGWVVWWIVWWMQEWMGGWVDGPFEELSETGKSPVVKSIELGVALVDFHFLVVQTVEGDGLRKRKVGGKVV